MSCRTCCCKKLSLIFALLALVVLAAPAFAQTPPPNNCLKDEYGKNVQCTANDVRVAFADNPRALDGSSLTSCIAGSTFSFVADFHVTTTATARENIGLYFQTAGGANALTGTCSDNIIAPPHHVANDVWCLGSGTGGGTTCPAGNGTYEELDTSTPTDTCGDISTSDNNQIITVEVDNVLCKAGANGQLALPNCTSWQQPGGTILCVSPAPNWPWVPAAIPGSPSKCNCENGFTVPIQVQSPSVSVAKSCTTTLTSGLNTSCDAGAEGGSVTYTVAITNSSNFGDVIVDQICDTAYGTIFRAGAPFAGPVCLAGGFGAMTSTTCTALDIASGTTGECTFLAAQAENLTVKNMVSVTGHGASGGTSFGPQNSNPVTVTSTDAPSTATTTKTSVSTTKICATVRYGVDVKNTSGAEETLTLSALLDDGFGDITQWTGSTPTPNASVLGTTCGVASGAAGLGSLSGSTGGGTLSATIAVGGHYTCQFDATFCAAPGPLIGTTCTPPTGIQHKNTVTPTLTGDEGGETVTDTIGSLTVTECVSAQ